MVELTERASHCLALAEAEAFRCRVHYVATEHLLLGLIRDPDCTAMRIICAMGMSPDDLKKYLESVIWRGELDFAYRDGDRAYLTPRSKSVIALAIDEAARAGQRKIGTEHLLAGLVREGEGIAASILQYVGVTLDTLREQTANVLAESDTTVDKLIP
jgi:ATP-dependent Clp protease ATP-binding subunit ClpC